MWKIVLWFLFCVSTAATMLMLLSGGAWTDYAAISASVAGGIAIGMFETFLSPDDLKKPRLLTIVLATIILAASAVFNLYLDAPYMKALNMTAGFIAAVAATQIGKDARI
ncbi:hypothetical protein AD951_02700 [Acetobacter malorum]|uniref:Holin n=1 Tax=Acetobacter malorum TaxID=178901 RepID=A0A149URL9_9PROT|nr:hypothetical protein [Acetobacter malorum]KXV70535.1 hypothetical protein AD951_02700 [Acetobacter malorum]